jgi:tRNA threonylcarbamoyladenosine biosynthesis protein TsaE
MRKLRASRSPRPVQPARLASGTCDSPTVVHSRSLAETVKLGHTIGALAQGGEVLALHGEVGAGKTAFVRGLASGLGAPPRNVASPTFVLVHEYHGRLRLAHADLYRLGSADTLAQLGLDEYFDGKTVVAVEWAERALSELPLDRLDIHFAHHSQTERTMTLSATGSRSQETLAHIVTRTSHARADKTSKKDADRVE